MLSLYDQIRRAERLLAKLLAKVKPENRCHYQPHAIRCHYPRKRGFIFCSQHLKEYLYVSESRKPEDLALN